MTKIMKITKGATYLASQGRNLHWMFTMVAIMINLSRFIMMETKTMKMRKEATQCLFLKVKCSLDVHIGHHVSLDDDADDPGKKTIVLLRCVFIAPYVRLKSYASLCQIMMPELLIKHCWPLITKKRHWIKRCSMHCRGRSNAQ